LTLPDKDYWVRKHAVEALGDIGDSRAVDPLIEALKYKNEYVRVDAAIALGKIGDNRAVEPLTNALRDKDSYVRSNAVEALEKIYNKKICSHCGYYSKKNGDKVAGYVPLKFTVTKEYGGNLQREGDICGDEFVSVSKGGSITYTEGRSINGYKRIKPLSWTGGGTVTFSHELIPTKPINICTNCVWHINLKLLGLRLAIGTVLIGFVVIIFLFWGSLRRLLPLAEDFLYIVEIFGWVLIILPIFCFGPGIFIKGLMLLVKMLIAKNTKNLQYLGRTAASVMRLGIWSQVPWG